MTMPDPTPDPAVLSDARALIQGLLGAIPLYWAMDEKDKTVVRAARRYLATPPASDAPASEAREDAVALANRLWNEFYDRKVDPKNTLRELISAVRSLAAAPKVASDTGAGLRRLIRGAARMTGDLHPETAAYNEGWNDALGHILAALATDATDGATGGATGGGEAGMREAARLAFALEVSQIDRDALLTGLTADEIDNIIDGVLAAASLSTSSTPSEAKGGGEVEREEAAHMQTISERDAAEAALSDAYRAVCGREPEWSNLFGYEDAVEDMRLATTPGGDLLEQAARKALALVSYITGLPEDLRWTPEFTRWVSEEADRIEASSALKPAGDGEAGA